MTTLSRMSLLLLVPMLLISCARKTEQEQASATSTPPASPAPTHAQVSPGMLTSWMIGLVNRQPSPNAESAISLGVGALEMSAPADSKTWSETADVDSNGVQEKVVFMWDGGSRTMYAYTRDPVTLQGGVTVDQGLMVVQFGEGNTKDREPGSGWYAYALTRESTAADQASGTLFGCTFDHRGAVGECGTGTWARDKNEFQIAADGH